MGGKQPAGRGKAPSSKGQVPAAGGRATSKAQGKSPGAAVAKAQAKAPRSARTAAPLPAKGTRKPAPLQKPAPKAGPKAAAKVAAKVDSKANPKSAPKTVSGAKGPPKSKAKTAVTPAAKLPRETTKQTQGKMRGQDPTSPATQPGAALPTKGKNTKSNPAAQAATQVVAPRGTSPAARTPLTAPKAALPQRARLAAEIAQAKADANIETKGPAPLAAVPESDAAAPAASGYFTEPEVPKGPFAEHTTEDLWVLYRAEADRLKLAENTANAEADEELDEEAELRRLVEEERAEREREAALARGEATEASGESEGAEAAPELQFVQRPGGRRERNSPALERLRNELIERHYPLVRYIAERLLQTLPKSIELDDLVSAGQFGLMDAIRGFDPGRGIKFKTYCSTRIRGSILDQLRSQDWVPRLVRLKATRIDKALQRLTGEFGREPTHAELARALEMEHGELAAELMESQARTMFSLSEKWDDDDEGSVEKVEILEDRAAIDPVHELNRRDLMVFMTRSLTHKERFIIEQYYQYGHTMREIGEMLTLTESRVCQIHSNVMGRLKGLLAQRGDTLSS